MTTHRPSRFAAPTEGAGRQVAQLAYLRSLVEQVAGRAHEQSHTEDSLDRSAIVSAAYADALPVVAKRFDALAGETARWGADAVEAILAGDGAPPQVAAGVLADELLHAESKLHALLGLR